MIVMSAMFIFIGLISRFLSRFIIIIVALIIFKQWTMTGKV